MRNRSFVRVLSLAALLVVPSVHAAPVTYSDRTAFDLATGPTTLIDFQEFPMEYPSSLGGNGWYTFCLPADAEPCTISSKGVDFTSTVGLPTLSLSEYTAVDPTERRLRSNQIPLAPDDFFIEFTGDVFGIDLLNSSNSGRPVTLEFAGGIAGDFSWTIDVSTAGAFFGITGLENTDWTVSLFDGDGGDPTLNTNFSIADIAVNPVPIPAAAWLFASALGVFGYLGKRRLSA